MWVRKSDAEIQSQRRKDRVRPLAPLVFTILSATLGLLFLVGGWTTPYGTGYRPPMSLSTAFPRVVTVSLLIFVLTYVVQTIFPGWYRERRHQAFICPTCRSVYTDGAATTCSCGTALEPLSMWRWQEDREATPNT
jgi:uncharacterized membrane protein